MSSNEKISEALKAAKDADMPLDQIREMRRLFKIDADWQPTKKRDTPEHRKARRGMQKASRRKNRKRK